MPEDRKVSMSNSPASRSTTSEDRWCVVPESVLRQARADTAEMLRRKGWADDDTLARLDALLSVATSTTGRSLTQPPQASIRGG